MVHYYIIELEGVKVFGYNCTYPNNFYIPEARKQMFVYSKPTYETISAVCPPATTNTSDKTQTIGRSGELYFLSICFEVHLT